MTSQEKAEMTDRKKLEGKVAIVTGATSGMGNAIARTFAREGGFTILSGRDISRGRGLEEEIRREGGRAAFVAGDISVPEVNQQLVEAALSAFGKIDILSINAGTLGLGKVTMLSEERWHDTINTNLSAIYYLCRAALPDMLKQDSGSILINASIAAFKGFPNHPAYCASKAGAVALARQLAVDYAPKVRVNAICPGPVDTPLLRDSAQAFENPEEAVPRAIDKTLLKKLGDPLDIAKLALFLVSEDASWITGSAFRIDGGITVS